MTSPSDGDAAWVAVPIALPPAGRVAAFEVAGRRLLLCNAEGTARVLVDECPHGGVPLAPGVLRGCVLECPFHGGKLDVVTGAPVALPIRRPVAVLPVRSGASGLEVRVRVESRAERAAR